MTEADWPVVAAIYREGITTGHATFAAEPPATYAEFCDGVIVAGSDTLLLERRRAVAGAEICF